MQKPAKTQVPINEVIANRWSGRAYDANKAVSHEQIISLCEAARWAPSCFGDEPWRFIVWNKNTDKASWQKAFDCLVPGNQEWVKDAPVLLLSCADTVMRKNQKPNRFGQHDTGAAAENLCLQAQDLGLMAHQMGGFDADAARSAFKIPEQFTVMAMIAVGYAADINTVTGEALKRETAERERRPLAELFFDSAWEKAI